jgi:AcrR family transcriptional regulator
MNDSASQFCYLPVVARVRPAHRFDEILDAATRVFGAKGLARTKMSDIAAEAGVSQGTLYNYVESKEALFRLLLDRGLGAPPPEPRALPLPSPPPEALAQRMDQAIAHNFGLPKLDAALARRRVTDARAELAGVIDELFERTAATRQAADVLERSAFEVPQLAAVFYGKVRRGLLHRLTTLIERRMAGGHYRRNDAKIVARLIVENVTLFARHIHHDIEPPGFDLGEARRVMIDTLVAGIVAR